MNFPTLALGFAITVHVTTYKCRQTVAELWLSYSVNQDTRQTCEKKIDCQAKNVNMQTTAFWNKPSSGCLGNELLPDVERHLETTEPLGQRLFCFLFLNYFIPFEI